MGAFESLWYCPFNASNIRQANGISAGHLRACDMHGPFKNVSNIRQAKGISAGHLRACDIVPLNALNIQQANVISAGHLRACDMHGPFKCFKYPTSKRNKRRPFESLWHGPFKVSKYPTSKRNKCGPFESLWYCPFKCIKYPTSKRNKCRSFGLKATILFFTFLLWDLHLIIGFCMQFWIIFHPPSFPTLHPSYPYYICTYLNSVNLGSKLS